MYVHIRLNFCVFPRWRWLVKILERVLPENVSHTAENTVCSRFAFM